MLSAFTVASPRTLTIAARAVVACLPVLLFLTTLVLLDTFRLVRRRRVAVALVAGGVTALATYFVNTWLLDLTGLPSWRFAAHALVWRRTR